MTNDTDGQGQAAVWAPLDSGVLASPTRRTARARTRPVPTETGGEVGELWTIDQVATHLGIPKQTIHGCA